MVTPYLIFSGECGEALAFYRAAFGAEVRMSLPYGDYVPEGVAAPPPNLKDWVLHAEMQICGTDFWFADEAAEPSVRGNRVRLTVQVPTAEAARKIFDALRAGGHTHRDILQQVSRRADGQIRGGLEHRRRGEP